MIYQSLSKVNIILFEKLVSKIRFTDFDATFFQKGLKAALPDYR